MFRSICNEIMIMVLFTVISLNVDVLLAASGTENNRVDAAGCNEYGDCPSSSNECHRICGCDRFAYEAYYYNETSKTCELSFKHLMISQLKKYENDQEESDGSPLDTMEEKIRVEAEHIFNTILVSVILFLTCCAVCFVSACLYCCRMSYSDYRLKSDVKALAKKLKRDKITFKKSTRKPLEPVNESCNVVCEDAGVFVV